MNEQIDWKVGDRVTRVSAEHCSSMPMGEGTVTALSEYPNISHPIQVDGIHRPHINDIQRLGAPIWNGPEDGLPPIGLEIEVLWSSTCGTYVKGKVIAHDEERAVFRFTSGEREGEYQAERNTTFNGGALPNFRPIRTAEQLAAEERERQCLALAKATGLTPGASRVKTGIALYEAGARMPNDSKFSGSKS